MKTPKRSPWWMANGRFSSLPRSQDDLVPLGILHDCEAAPGLFLRSRGEFHAALHQLLVALFHVIDLPRCVHEAPDPILVTLGREEHDARLRAGNREFQPTLLFRELLVCEDAEAQFFGIEAQCPVLVPHRDSQKLDSFDHKPKHASGPLENQWPAADAWRWLL